MTSPVPGPTGPDGGTGGTDGGLTVVGLDVATRLRVHDPSVGRDLRGLLAGLLVPDGSRPVDDDVEVVGRGPYEVRGDGVATAAAADAPAAVGHCLAALNLRATSLTPHLACHSALLARDGAGLVVPAASGSGKSTLTAALVARGWRYGSDEAVGLTWDDGAVVAYPRPFALSAWSAAATGTTGGVPGDGETYHLPRAGLSTDVTVRDVVLLRRRAGAPDLRPLHRAVALQELLRRAFTHHRDPARALVLYADLLRAASCWELSLGDPLAAADLLTDRLPSG
ncbi:hypothetical protein [Aquipuribacter sp. SD81]|uniref:hypothetical protein n=1 Tax=Aquipuribacter sp. SD81 TaxID=3127703 RepID=UPI00301802D1